jgi:hypothetical protein
VSTLLEGYSLYPNKKVPHRGSKMHCIYPKPAGKGLRSCGGCYPCRINGRRIWTGRILLESLFVPETSFVTLTYEDRHVPINELGLEVLHRKDYERFIRQFKRSAFGPNVRYYGVAEYGDKSLRPHYHFILFGVGAQWLPEITKAWSVRIKPKDVTRKAMKEGRIFRDNKNRLCETIGYVHVDPLIPERAAYAARYVVKKMNKDDDSRLCGRPPEWRSMSKQHGGLGSSAIGWLADMHATKAGSEALKRRRDVFNGIKIDGKVFPLGEYLRNQLREVVGIPSNQDRRDLEHADYVDDQELVFTPPFDLYSVRGLPANRKVLDEQSKAKAAETIPRISKEDRQAHRRQGGAKI